MKKVLLSLGICLVNALSFAQTASISSTDAKTSNTSGAYTFVVSEEVSKPNLDEVKGYYKNQLSAEMKDGSQNLTINLIQNDANGRLVLRRLLSALELKAIIVDGTELSIDEFAKTYLK